MFSFSESEMEVAFSIFKVRHHLTPFSAKKNSVDASKLLYWGSSDRLSYEDNDISEYITNLGKLNLLLMVWF